MARLIVLLTLGSTLSGAELFRFRSEFWLNLHHFLYVLGRSANGEADSKRAAVVNAPEDLAAFERLAQELKTRGAARSNITSVWCRNRMRCLISG